MSDGAMSTGNDIEAITRSRGSLTPAEKKEALDRFMSHLAVTGDRAASARYAGISDRTAATWTCSPGFEKALFRERCRAIQVDGAGLAYKVAAEMIGKDETPAAVRAQLSKMLLGLAGHAEATAAAEAQGSAVAALHELTEDQLARHIAAASATLAALQAQPVTIEHAPDVTPHQDDIASLL